MTKKKTPYPKGRYPRTEEHRRKISEANKGRKGPMTGKKHSDNAKRKIRASLMRRWRIIVRPKAEERTCNVCKTVFKMTNGSKPDRRFCSKSCATRSKGSGPDHHNWKGGRHINFQGYVVVRVDKKYILEHRHVMEQILGRPLTEKEEVHHRDANRQNNAPENLELRSGPHGSGATKHCPTCTCCVI